MVFEAYLQDLLEQIAVQTEAPGANQTEYSKLGSSSVDQRENALVQIVIIENPNHPVMVQHGFLGQGGQIRHNVKAPYGEIGNNVPRVCPIVD